MKKIVIITSIIMICILSIKSTEKQAFDHEKRKSHCQEVEYSDVEFDEDDSKDCLKTSTYKVNQQSIIKSRLKSISNKYHHFPKKTKISSDGTISGVLNEQIDREEVFEKTLIKEENDQKDSSDKVVVSNCSVAHESLYSLTDGLYFLELDIDTLAVELDELIMLNKDKQILQKPSVSNVPFGSIQQLLNDGNIFVISIEGCLDLSNLNITSLIGLNGIAAIETVRYLNLSHNKLERIESEIFYRLQNLIIVDFSYNQLKNIESEIFDTLLDLEIVDLSNNQLENIELTFPINYLYLNNNRLTVENVEAIKKYYKKNRSERLKIEDQNPQKFGSYTKVALRETRSIDSLSLIHDQVEKKEDAIEYKRYKKIFDHEKRKADDQEDENDSKEDVKSLSTYQKAQQFTIKSRLKSNNLKYHFAKKTKISSDGAIISSLLDKRKDLQ